LDKKSERLDFRIFGADDGTYPLASGAVIGSDCHRQSFTTEPSSPVPSKQKTVLLDGFLFWCG
jgi:hypothetical protein